MCQYLNSSTRVFQKPSSGYLAEHYQAWVYLFIGVAPAAPSYLGMYTWEQQFACLLTQFTAPGLETKAKSKYESHSEWVNVTSLLVFLLCVRPPVIINTAFLLRKKIVSKVIRDKPHNWRTNTITQHLFIDYHRKKKHHSVCFIVLRIFFGAGFLFLCFHISFPSLTNTKNKRYKQKKPPRGFKLLKV